MIRELARPIFEVAGVSPSAVSIYIVNDPSLNAFVAGGQNIFVHTGLLMDARTPEELIGVLAHETGHLAGGHLARGSAALEEAQRTAILTTLLGIAAAIAAGEPGAGAALATAGPSIAQRSFLSYTRAMENSADQAGMAYLEAAGISSEGLMNFLQRLENQELLSTNRQVEYVRTHPLTRDRVEAIRAFVERSPLTGQAVPAGLRDRFDRMQAKLIGYLQPQQALRRYSATATDIPSRYGRALALFRTGSLDEALAIMTDLIAAEPNNPFFAELTGQMLLENGRIDEARSYYERAAAALPNEPLILVALAQTKIATERPEDLASAVADLEWAVEQPGGSTPFTWRLLAIAYGRSGDLGRSALALAEEALAAGNEEEARQQAARALRTLAHGSPGWLRATDIQAVTQPR